MGNLVSGLLLIAFSLSGIVTFYKTFKRRKESEASVWLMLLSVSTVLWAITYALFFLLPVTDAALFCHEIRYATVMFSGWFIFLFLCQALKYRMLGKNILSIFMLFPALNTAVILTNRYTHLFITYFGLSEKNGVRIPIYQYGPWFIFHCVFSYIPLLAGAIIIIRQFMRLPAKRKALVGLLFFGMVITFITTLMAVFDLLPYPVDLSPMVIQATQAIFYYTLFNSKALDMIFISRNFIFENSRSILLITDMSGIIVDCNLKAKEIADSISIEDLTGMRADEFIETWKQASHSHTFEEDPSIFTIAGNETETHYQVHINDVIGEQGEAKGSYIEITNITPIMSLIHMLQDAAYYDNLTGLPNRNYFSKKIHEIDNPESLPLCVMVGDVNSLKAVNDIYGHVKGDELLKRISNILLLCTPPNGMFFRTGGDEFVGLLPNTTTEQADQFIRDIEEYCNKIEDQSFKQASVALGYKIKITPAEKIEDLIKAADYEMYTTKRNRRESAT